MPPLLRPPPTFRRFATTYTARVVRSDTAGRSLAVELAPQTLIFDHRSASFPLPRRHVICRSVQILKSPQSPDPLLDLSEYLQTLAPSPTPSEISEILKSLNPHPKLALQFFRFASHSFRHDPFTYNRALQIISKTDPGSVWGIVEEMRREGVRGNISTVNILIGVVGGGEIEKCLELVREWGLEMTAYSYKCAVQAYLRGREAERAYKVWGEMRRKGYRLDVFGYNMLLDSLSKADMVRQAYKVFEDMKRKSCSPDVYTYTILIRMSGKAGKVDESLSYFEEMIKRGFSLNAIAYNTMIEALAKNKMVDKAISVFSKMIQNDCQPNEFTYTVILYLLAVEGELDRLDQVVEISGKYMNKSLYAYLVRRLSKLGHASLAHRLFCSMWSFHDKGDRDAYVSMLETLCNAGKTLEAIDLLTKIHEKGIDKDVQMYNMVFSALGKQKQISYTTTLFEEMKNDGILPDVFTYNILISSFGKVGLVNKASELFEEMEQADCQPDVVTYNSLIHCLGKNGELDEAHMRFIEMQEKGLNPDVFTYSTLIECFGKSNKVEMACGLYEEMLDQGCLPNIVTYNSLLDCLEKCGKKAEAFDLYASLKKQGLNPDSITYSILDRLENNAQLTTRVRKPSRITGWVVSPLR